MSSQGGHDHQVLGNIFADFVQGKDASLAAKSNVAIIDKHYKSRLPVSHQGSWNIPPLAMAMKAVQLGDSTAAADFTTYCEEQLGGCKLWGKEILSWLYWEPPAIAGAVCQWARGKNDRLAEASGQLVEAHLLTLALFSQKAPGKDEQLVWGPGIRTSVRNPENLGQSFLLAHATRKGVRMPVNPEQAWAWPWRIAAGVDFLDFLDEDLLKLLRRHQQNGRAAAEIVDRLGRLGVGFQAPVQVCRYASGDMVAWIAKNTHGTKPPVLATSIVGGEYHRLHGEEGAGWDCDRSGAKVVATKGARRLEIPAPDDDQEVLYDVAFSRQGVRLARG